MIGFVFGLAIDYQVLLVTRMREEHVHGTPARDAVRSGFSHGGRVVAAALVTISIFEGQQLRHHPGETADSQPRAPAAAEPALP